MNIYPGGVLRKMEKLEGTRRDGPCVCPPRLAWQGKPSPSPELQTVINYQPLIGVYQPTFQSRYIWLLIQFFVRCQMCFFVSSEESSGCDGARNGISSLLVHPKSIYLYIFIRSTHVSLSVFGGSHNTVYIFEGNLEVKLPTIWTDEKQRWEESEKRRAEESRSKRESLRRNKIQVRIKVGNTMCFQWFVAPEGWKVGSLKRRVRSQLARWEMKNCTPLWREANF